MDDIDQLRTQIESGERFKTAINGYDKKQVTETVTQLTIENAELNKQLDKARSENINLKKQLRDLQREQAGLGQAGASSSAPQVDLDALEEEIAARYQSQIDALNAQLRQARDDDAALNTLEEEIAAKYQSQIDFLSEQLRQAQADAAAARSRADAAGESSGKSASDLGASFVVDELKRQINRLNDDKRKRGMRIAELEEMLQQERDNADGRVAMLVSLNDNMSSMLQEKLNELQAFADGWKDAFASTAV